MHLAGHDAAAGLVSRQQQLAQAAARAAAQQPKVVGHLVQRGGGGTERAAERHQRVMRSQRLKLRSKAAPHRPAAGQGRAHESWWLVSLPSP